MFKMNQSTEQIIVKIIEDALNNLFSIDKIILDAKLKEECINHVIAVYIKKSLDANTDFKDEKYFVDLEYNKITKTGGPKKSIKGKNIRPDIIIHKRDDEEENNLCVLEIKKNYCIKADKDKIIGLLKSNLKYKYGFAVSLKLDRKSGPLVKFYQRDLIEKNENDVRDYYFDVNNKELKEK